MERLAEPRLVLERGPNTFRQALGVALGRAFPSQLGQRLLGRERGIVAFLGILIGQLVEREAATIHDLEGAGQRLRVAAEQSMHLFGRSEEHTSELQSLMRISYAVFC